MNRSEKIINMINQRAEHGPSIDDVVETNFSIEDIMHYLHTEQDARRMAKWCRMFLELDY
jgi:hypothetical protein